MLLFCFCHFNSSLISCAVMMMINLCDNQFAPGSRVIQLRSNAILMNDFYLRDGEKKNLAAFHTYLRNIWNFIDDSESISPSAAPAARFYFIWIDSKNISSQCVYVINSTMKCRIAVPCQRITYTATFCVPDNEYFLLCYRLMQSCHQPATQLNKFKPFIKILLIVLQTNNNGNYFRKKWFEWVWIVVCWISSVFAHEKSQIRSFLSIWK